MNPASAASVSTLSMDFYDRGSAKLRFDFQPARDSDSGAFAWRVDFENGTISNGLSGTYATGTALRLDWVFNFSEGDLDVGGTTFLANTAYLFIDGALVDSAQPTSSSSTASTMNRLSLAPSADAEVLIDDVLWVDEIVNPIPEPASLALLGLGGLMIAGRRRQA